MTHLNPRKFAWPLLAALLLAAPPALCESQHAAGLDSLDESRLMQELANRGMDKLLDRCFDLNKVSDDERRSIRSIQAMRLINDRDSFMKRSPAERQRIVRGVADGIQAILPTMHDPKLLLSNAATLIINGTARSVNLLEYWGPNPSIQADLKPIAEAIVAMLDKAITEAGAQADAALNKVRSPQDQAGIKVWEQWDGLRNLAKYNKANAMYILALACDVADPERKQMCDDAIEILKVWDDPDSDVQEAVRFRIGMLDTVKGAADPTALPDAKTYFQEVVADPKAPAADKFQAQYFSAVCDLQAKQLDACQKGLDDLRTWEQANLAGNQDMQQGAEAALSMLQFRIYNAQAEAAGAGAARQGFNDKAISVLLQLVQARPDLRGLIFEMVLQRLPEKPDMKQLDPLLLGAIVMKGIDEVAKPDTEKADLVVLQRAADADRELIAREHDVNITAADRDLAGFRLGLLLHRLADDGPPDKSIANHKLAVEAYIDYLRKFQDKDRREFALDSILGIVGEFRANPATRSDPQVREMYESALELAVHLGRARFTYEYAKMLFDKGDRMKDAAEAFGHVPDDPTKPTQKIMAEYYQMLATQEIQKTIKEAGNQDELARQIETVATDLSKRIDAALPMSSDDLRPRLRQVRVRTTVIAAESARARKDPQGVLNILSGFETQIQGVSATGDLLGYVLFLRINAQMALGKVEEARAGLKEFIDSTPDPKQRLGVIGMILEKIDESYNQAVKRGDDKAISELGDQCADLADMLVKEADKNPGDPAAKEYRKYKARIMRLVAIREKDPVKKHERLLAALDAYRALLKDAPNDPTILRFMALIQFDLGEFKDARELIIQMVSKKMFGPPMVDVTDPVTLVVTTKPNEVYWEAMYKLMCSDLELAKSDPTQASLRDDVIDQLKRLYIEWGKDLGGTTWAPQFMELRQQLIPTWTGDSSLEAPTTAPAPVTAPSTAP